MIHLPKLGETVPPRNVDGRFSKGARRKRKPKVEETPEPVDASGVLTPEERAALYVKTRDPSVLGPPGGGARQRALEYVPPSQRPRPHGPRKDFTRVVYRQPPMPAEAKKRAKLIKELRVLLGDPTYRGVGKPYGNRGSLRWHAVTPEGKYATW